MDQKQMDQAAELFVTARQGGAPIRALPEACCPSNVADANAILQEVTRRLNEPVGGWKITFVFRPRQGRSSPRSSRKICSTVRRECHPA